MVVPDVALELFDDGLVLHVGDSMIDFEIVQDIAFLQSRDPETLEVLVKLLRMGVDRVRGRVKA